MNYKTNPVSIIKDTELYKTSLLTKNDIPPFVFLRHSKLKTDKKESLIKHYICHLQSYTDQSESIFVTHLHDKLVGTICLLKLQPLKYALSNLAIKNDVNYEKVFNSLLEKTIQTALHFKASELEYRLIEGSNSEDEILTLLKLGFSKSYERIEFKKDIKEIPDFPHSPIHWESLPDLSESNLRTFAETMKQASVGDPDTQPDENFYESLLCILDENDLTNSPDCFQVGIVDKKPMAVLIAQVNPNTGWSRITYMGVLPSFRNKGYGAWVHRQGILALKKQGGTFYQGGTLTQNTHMIKLFEKLGCEKLRKMQGWKLKM